MAIITQEIYDFVAAISLELFFAFCFGVAFALLQVMKIPKGTKGVKAQVRQTFKVVHAEASSGNAAKAVAAWRAAKEKQPANDDTLKVVTQALLDAEPVSLATEIYEHFRHHPSRLSDPKAAAAVLEVIAQSGKADILESMFQMFTQKLHIPAKVCMQEAMLSGYAMAGNRKKVDQLLIKLVEARQKVTVRGYSFMIKGFLKNGMIDATVEQVMEMQSQGLNVPSYAVTEIFKVAAQDAGCLPDLFNTLSEKVPMTRSAIVAVLEHCLTTLDVTLTKKVEKHIRRSKEDGLRSEGRMTFEFYDFLAKVYTSTGDAHATELFEEMKSSLAYINDGLCVNLISRCAEPKSVRFAESIVAHLRLRSKMSLSAYVGLMKVYSGSGMYRQACDLYDQILADGLEPDSMMYGCLMKFSADCGRTELTRELVSKASGFDIHHQMALIRAAGQDKDVDTAFSILHKLRNAEVALDTLVYNAVLDVCSSCGEMKRARELATEMRKGGMIDQISFNTLLKGYSVCGDMRGAKEVFLQMEEAGFSPNDVSYNCLINLAASSGDLQTAWKTIETMDRKGVKIDCYTVSTMMKALKQTSNVPRDACSRVIALLDRHGIDVCSEEVLLNTALEACIKHFEHKQLEKLLNVIEARRFSMKLATHSYATLIRANSMLKRLKRCRDLWTEMTEERCLEPNNVALGCILDALVCNNNVWDAVKLFRKWENRVEPSTVIYSTLIKGFATARDNKSATEMWQEFCKKSLPVNTMVYNAIIDAHARVGAMDEVSALVGSMDAAGCKPDDITMSMVAKGYSTNGDLDKAMEVFHNLSSKVNANTVVVYNTILDGCVRHERADLADVLLDSMEAWHIEPSNFTLGIIVKLWGNRHQLDKALTAVETLPKKYGFTPNGPVWTCLLFACLRNNALDTALATFRKLRESGHPVDSKVFNALINTCTRGGKWQQGCALVEEAYGLQAASQRVIPSSEDLDARTMTNFMQMLNKHGVMQKVGAPLMQKMRSAKVPVSPSLMTAALGEKEQSTRPWRQQN